MNPKWKWEWYNRHLQHSINKYPFAPLVTLYSLSCIMYVSAIVIVCNNSTWFEKKALHFDLNLNTLVSSSLHQVCAENNNEIVGVLLSYDSERVIINQIKLNSAISAGPGATYRIGWVVRLRWDCVHLRYMTRPDSWWRRFEMKMCYLAQHRRAHYVE